MWNDIPHSLPSFKQRHRLENHNFSRKSSNWYGDYWSGNKSEEISKIDLLLLNLLQKEKSTLSDTKSSKALSPKNKNKIKKKKKIGAPTPNPSPAPWDFRSQRSWYVLGPKWRHQPTGRLLSGTIRERVWSVVFVAVWLLLIWLRFQLCRFVLHPHANLHHSRPVIYKTVCVILTQNWAMTSVSAVAQLCATHVNQAKQCRLSLSISRHFKGAARASFWATRRHCVSRIFAMLETPSALKLGAQF